MTLDLLVWKFHLRSDDQIYSPNLFLKIKLNYNLFIVFEINLFMYLFLFLLSFSY